MVSSTKVLHRPIVTLLSQSPDASRAAQDALARLFRMEPLAVEIPSEDNLNSLFSSSLPFFSFSWDSRVSVCQTTSTALHFLSLQGNTRASTSKANPLDVVALSDASKDEDISISIGRIRSQFSSALKGKSASIGLQHLLGRSIQKRQMLHKVSTGGLPLLDLPDSHTGSVERQEWNRSDLAGLKEVVIPFHDSGSYANGSDLMSNLSQRSSSRATVGLYQLSPDSPTCIRPLPTGTQDKITPNPAFVFHTDDFAAVDVSDYGASSARIGFGGLGVGQLMISHKDLQGMDVRFCCRTKHSTFFAEAQDSLLAGSLDNLQSSNVLLKGGEKQPLDNRLGSSDCWVELRESVKHPSRFWDHEKEKKVARAPDLPFQ